MLNGAATFYTTEERVVTKLGQYEALYIPESTPYWFESSSPVSESILVPSTPPGPDIGPLYPRRVSPRFAPRPGPGPGPGGWP